MDGQPIAIDIGRILSPQTLGIIGLVFMAFVTLAPMALSSVKDMVAKWWSSLPDTWESSGDPSPPAPGEQGEKVDTDKQPPPGFAQHVALIVNASPYADAPTQLQYLSHGMTEAEVLRAEVTRMGGGSV